MRSHILYPWHSTFCFLLGGFPGTKVMYSLIGFPFARYGKEDIDIFLFNLCDLLFTDISLICQYLIRCADFCRYRVHMGGQFLSVASGICDTSSHN